MPLKSAQMMGQPNFFWSQHRWWDSQTFFEVSTDDGTAKLFLKSAQMMGQPNFFWSQHRWWDSETFFEVSTDDGTAKLFLKSAQMMGQQNLFWSQHRWWDSKTFFQVVILTLWSVPGTTKYALYKYTDNRQSSCIVPVYGYLPNIPCAVTLTPGNQVVLSQGVFNTRVVFKQD